MVMIIGDSGLIYGATARKEGFDISKLRALISQYLRVDVTRVSDDAHLSDDLGADWLERLELIILIEEFAGVEVGDDDADQVETVGDLIRHVSAI
jgi:acyl carrier protein